MENVINAVQNEFVTSEFVVNVSEEEKDLARRIYDLFGMRNGNLCET